MRSHKLFFAKVSFVVLCAVCPVAASDDFSGTWQSERVGSSIAAKSLAGSFALELSQKGKVVTGSYLNGEGKIAGIVRAGALRFTWEDEFGVGSGTFQISKDGQSLIGSWLGRADNLRSVRGTWSATRAVDVGTRWEAKPPEKPSKSLGRTGFYGTFLTTTPSGNFEMVLSWDGNEKVTGTFSGNGSAGTITGQLFGNILIFKWSQDNGKYRGSGKFTLSADGQSFTGTYSNNLKDPNDASAGSWNGRRK